VDIKIQRNKDDNLQIKTQSGMVMYGMHMDKHDIAAVMDLNSDNEGMVQRWKEAEQEWQEQQKKTGDNTPPLDKTEPKTPESTSQSTPQSTQKVS
jgi:hypothetical protein